MNNLKHICLKVAKLKLRYRDDAITLGHTNIKDLRYKHGFSIYLLFSRGIKKESWNVIELVRLLHC